MTDTQQKWVDEQTKAIFCSLYNPSLYEKHPDCKEITAIRTALTAALQEGAKMERERNEKWCKAYAIFEADVMDGIKPEIAQKKLLAAIAPTEEKKCGCGSPYPCHITPPEEVETVDPGTKSWNLTAPPEESKTECANCGCQKQTHPIPECKQFIPQPHK